MSEEISKVRNIIRKDLSSVGLIPTGMAIQLVANDNAPLGFSLYIEAVYVHMYAGKSYTELLDYIKGPLQIQDNNMQRYLISTALHIRSSLVANAGNHKLAYKSLMLEKGAEKEVLQKLIESCVRVSSEFNVPWTKKYEFNELYKTKNNRSILGCMIILGALILVGFIIYKLII
jgi:hypothetical protein